MNVNRGAASKSLLLALSDAGDGAGTWTIEVKAQAQPSGVQIVVPGAVTIAPGGSAQIPVTANAAASAAAGEAYGFLLLRRGTVTRKVAYALLVTRPGLESAPVVPLRQIQSGDTRRGVSRASVYKYPAAAFGPAPNYTGAPVNEDGGETLYRIRLDEPAVNVGAAVIASSAGSLVHPWFLGSPDENDVQGYAGLPVNVNNLTIDYPLDIGAAGTVFPRTKAYYVAVDSGRDLFTGRSLGGSYVLQAWVDDVQPPLLGLLTERVSAGRPTIALRVLDLGSGVDPYSLVIGYGQSLIGAALYDPASGIALFPIPNEAPALRAGKRQVQASAADFQEAKNVDSVGDELLPNTAFAGGPVSVVDGPTITWLTPEIRECVPATTPLTVLAGSTAAIRSITVLQRQEADRHRSPRRGRDLRDDLAPGRREGQVHAPRRSSPTRRAATPKPSASPAAARRLRPVKIAVITGASSGIGEATARELARRGWRPVLVARRRERLEQLAAELGGEYEVCDVSERADVDRAAAAILQRHGRIDLLVNNAGIPGRGDFLSLDPERIEAVLRTNYLGGVWMVRALEAALQPGSHVVNVVSVAGTVAFAPAGPYAASKHAQLAFSRSLAGLLAGRGVKVHTVLPGFVETEGFPQRSVLRSAFFRRMVITPELVAERIAGAVESGRREVFVPRWYRVFSLVQALLPGISARLVARSGYKRPAAG